MIAGYVKHELGEEAVNCFGRMQVAGVQPNRATFILMLKASICIGSVDKGMEMHGEVARRGFQGDLLLGSALVDMYAASRMLIKAREVFESLPMKSIVSWTSLIAGYAEHGFGAEALECFESMQSHGVSPNNVTLICGLKASGNIGSIEKVKEFHGTISKCGWLERDPVVGNALIDAYTKCGSLSTAQRVFDRLPIKDEVSWNALLMGYVNHGNYEEVLELFFKRMQSENVIPSSITFSCCLKACGTLGAINKGQALHDCIAASGLLEADPFLANALIEMYTKCGFLVKAQEVFDNLTFRDCLVSWNALIAGYGDRGDCDKVLSLFDDMVAKEGVRPDMVTFLGVLGACKHSGLVDKGCLYMRAMYDIYGITPMLEHYACLVDLLHRAGQLDMVTAAIKNLPFQPNRVLWHTILSAGRQWGRVELGEKGFEHAMELDATDDAAHVCLRNMYAELQMHDEAIKIQAMRVRKAGLV
jgi:pentatricopeptide repeat protein